MQRREPVLAVDDEVLALRLLEVADVGERLDGLEPQRVRREEQDGARDRRLADRRVVEVLDRTHLRPGHFPLKGRIGALDLPDEVRDVVVLLGLVGDDAPFALGVKARDESHPVKEVLRRVGGEIEDAVLLAYLRGKHGEWGRGIEGERGEEGEEEGPGCAGERAGRILDPGGDARPRVIA